jgi:Ca2+-binding EF-hand superfamily protein
MIFRIFDDHNSDSVTLCNLICIEKKSGETMTDKDIYEIIERVEEKCFILPIKLF